MEPGGDLESRLPAEPASARRARAFVVDALKQLQCGELAAVAELLVSELVTNAILHARTEVRVRITVDHGRVRVEVEDGSPAPARRRHFSTESATGRGLALVDALAAQWGSEVIDVSGKSVWFELHSCQAS